VFKNYDRLPVVADCQEYLPTNQLTYVNFREGYDKPIDAPFVPDVQMDYVIDEIRWVNNQARLQVSYTGPSTHAMTGLTFAMYPSEQTFQFNQGDVLTLTVKFVSNTPEIITVGYTVSEDDINWAIEGASTGLGNANKSILRRVLNGWAQQANAIDPGIFIPPGIIPSPVAVALGFSTPAYDVWVNNTNPIGVQSYPVVLRSTGATPSLKTGATHEFGIVYGDRAYRDSTVYTVDSMNLFVPWFSEIYPTLSNTKNPFTVTPKITINHIPPVWATKYWIVAKPATEILSFGQYLTNNDDNPAVGAGYVSSVLLDTANYNRYKIYIDNYYEKQNIGASIRHEIKIGDKLRFIRKNAYNNEYTPYLELDIVDIDPSGGNNGRMIVFTNLFNIGLIEPSPEQSANEVFGQLLEIYTPRPSVDDTGNVFVSTWKDVTESIQINNPHTVDRAHGSPVAYYVQVGYASSYYFYLPGDQSGLLNSTWNASIYNNDGTSTVGFNDRC